MARFGSLGTQYFDNSGNILTGGKIYFYESGTTTPKDTFADVNQSVANPNPVILTAAGRQPNVFFTGVAKAVLTNSGGTIITTADPVGQTGNVDDFDFWIPEAIYPLGAIVTYNNQFWQSLQNGNQGNTPAASSAFWQQITFLGVWNSAQTYSINNAVIASNGAIYRSVINSNTNNNPTAEDLTKWVGAVTRESLALNLVTKGSLFVGDGTGPDQLALGTNTHVLTADSTEALGVKWFPVPDTVRDYQEFTSSDDWTKPADAAFVYVELWSGGGGGANNTGGSQAGGGSGGEYVAAMFQASDLTSTVAVTIGAGGAGAAASGGAADGSAGGNSSFGAYLVAVGGNPGVESASNAFASVPRSLIAEFPLSTWDARYIALSQAGYGGSSNAGVGGSCTDGGGGGGGAAASGGAAGASAKGGAGGAGNSAGAGAAGTAPAGGGGASSSDAGGGAGARGEARIWTW